MSNEKKHVIIVGAGFAGFACARKLVEHDEVHVTLIDKHNYHQFTPLLYQVAAGELASEDVATPLRTTFSGKSNIDIKLEEVVSIDPKNKEIATKSGSTYRGDFLVLAAGSVVNFFDVGGARECSFPLYNLDNAENIRSRIIELFEEADRNPSLIEKGALNIVIVGAGPTGTELAGAFADMVKFVLPQAFSDLQVSKARIYLVDHSHAVLNHFSEESQAYAAKVLEGRGVELKLGMGVKEVFSDSVLLTDGSKILTRMVVWAGGLKAADMATNSGLSQGHGGRINVEADLSVPGYQGVYAIGDVANIPVGNGEMLPQLASVAQQSGYWVSKNILLEISGKSKKNFEYDDKGIMAMIGRNAAVAEIGKKRHELEGVIAFTAWLGVHAVLMSTVRQKVNAFLEWAWDYFGKKRPAAILDREHAAQIDWDK